VLIKLHPLIKVWGILWLTMLLICLEFLAFSLSFRYFGIFVSCLGLKSFFFYLFLSTSYQYFISFLSRDFNSFLFSKLSFFFVFFSPLDPSFIALKGHVVVKLFVVLKVIFSKLDHMVFFLILTSDLLRDHSFLSLLLLLLFSPLNV
jgi:hypothetical protein